MAVQIVLYLTEVAWLLTNLKYFFYPEIYQLRFCAFTLWLCIELYQPATYKHKQDGIFEIVDEEGSEKVWHSFYIRKTFF